MTTPEWDAQEKAMDDFVAWMAEEKLPLGDHKEYPELLAWYLAYRLAQDIAEWSTKDLARAISEGLSVSVESDEDIISEFTSTLEAFEGGLDELKADVRAFCTGE